MNENTLHQPNFKFDYDPKDPAAVKAVAEATAKIIRPGIYTNIPEDIYHALPLPSAHKLFTMRKYSPFHYWDKYVNPNRPVEKFESTSLTMGKAFHALVLEPLRAAGAIARAPECDMRTKIGKETMAEFKKTLVSDAIVLQPDDHERLMGMVSSFFKSEENRKNYQDVKGGLNEVTLIWDESGVKMRGRVDRITDGVLHDLKTANDLNRFAFGESANRYGYAWQLMIYQRAWFNLTGDVLSPLITAVESDRPFGTKRFSISDTTLQKEAEIFEKIITCFKYCHANDHWFSYSDEAEQMFTRQSYFDDKNWFDDMSSKVETIKKQRVETNVEFSRF